MKKIYLSLLIIPTIFLSACTFNRRVAEVLNDESFYADQQSTQIEDSKIVSHNEIKNLTYFINGEVVDLVDGSESKTIVEDSESQKITKYFGNEAEGDFNNDGLLDTAFILTQDLGGSGTFFYVTVALREEDGYFGTNAILLGDRIAPQSTEYINGEIIVNYQDRSIDDSFTTVPSIGVSRYFKIVDDNLTEILK